MKTKAARGVMVIMLSLTSIPAIAADSEFVFDTPSDDRWQYPFNFTPGARPLGSTFGAPGVPGFNDRDGALTIAWDTTDDIEPGLGPDSYEILSITVTLTNQANEFINPEWPIDLTVDEWFTYVGIAEDEDPGRPIELYGAGFGPQLTEESWQESSFFIGSTAKGDVPRDPFPFVYQDETFELVHVEDNIKGLHNDELKVPLCDDPGGVCPFTSIPWAIGEPVGYTPGMQFEPFDVVFDIDLNMSEGQVKKYFQEQLNTGRIIVSVTSLREADFQGPASGFPSFYMKEGVPLDPNARAGKLAVVLGAAVTGDLDLDETVDLDDWSGYLDCLSGPGLAPDPDSPLTAEMCLCTYDFDRDGDVDLLDAGEFTVRFTGP